jgi:hypothetical protein
MPRRALGHADRRAIPTNASVRFVVTARSMHPENNATVPTPLRARVRADRRVIPTNARVLCAATTT